VGEDVTGMVGAGLRVGKGVGGGLALGGSSTGGEVGKATG
jgi:hypothetical protein